MPRKDITIQVDGLKLPAAVFFPETNQPSPALCLCHGIPAGKYNPTEEGYPALAQKFCAAGFVTMIFNFRGTGLADGNLDMAGWIRDLGAVIDFLHNLAEVDKSRLCLLGSSAGAAVSAYVAAHDPRVSAVATFACPADFTFFAVKQQAESLLDHFRSIGLINDPGFPFSVEEWLEGFAEVSPIRWVDRISPRPLLLLHGDRDDIVPLENAYKLYERAGEPKRLIVLPGAGHRLRLEPKALDIALDWLKAQARTPKS
ncbi:MAG: alpha/beta fold hydrolase [Chloroflexi bacterium]|nr:alpha/beta fold hydrolase [Chloroflexota bacterium]MBM3173946.1 alpha/beta fold hydrolase [Chloroflexota bacterium]MBM3175545.1 alpha/beta fold hydrolase [Chloroflexota bacterium]MBM4451246.1 alpha/beta fold hydrolase [Chloroflexota bacterium]